MSDFQNLPVDMPPLGLSMRQDPQGFMLKVNQLDEWLANLSITVPTEFSFTVSVCDDTPRAWSARPLTNAELAAYGDCHRTVVACTDLWCEKVVVTEGASVLSPIGVEVEDVVWADGLPGVIYVMEHLIADVRSQYMSSEFQKIGFDSEKFLEETSLSLTDHEHATYLDAMVYIAYIHDVLHVPEMRETLHPLSLPLFEATYRELRQGMSELWEQNASFRTAEVDG